MSAKKTAGPDLYLVVREELTSGFGERYYHQTARVTTQRYETGQGYVPYGLDENYAGPKAVLFSDLRLRCQGDEKSRELDKEGVYGYAGYRDLEYHDVHGVDLTRAKRMVLTLDKLTKGLEKLHEKRGYHSSWGEYLGRVAEVIGVKGIAFEKSKDGYARTGEKYVWLSIGEGVNRANQLVAAWQHESPARVDKRRQEEREREREEERRRQLEADREALPAASMRLAPLTDATDDSEVVS